MLRSCVVFVFVSKCLLMIHITSASQCQLEKIFRTPKDMSRVNFDHFEIIERNGFDASESKATSSTTETPTTTPEDAKRNANVANAQVLVRFGGDEVYRNIHNIMKIPPKCRQFPDKIFPIQHHPLLSPLHGYTEYYHPYPLPIPFDFPSYYFYNYGSQYLPPQLKDYFRRHLGHWDEESNDRDFFLQNRQKKEPEASKAADTGKQTKENNGNETVDLLAVTKSTLEGIGKMGMESRAQKCLNPLADEKDDSMEKSMEIDENESFLDVEENSEKSIEKTNVISKKYSEKKEKVKVTNKKLNSLELMNELEALLKQALVKCRCINSTDSEKIMNSYPTLASSLHPKAKKAESLTPKNVFKPSAPKANQITLDLGRPKLSKMCPIPLRATLYIEVGEEGKFSGETHPVKQKYPSIESSVEMEKAHQNQIELPLESVAVITQQEPRLESKHHCKKCGHDLLKDDNFCSHCGCQMMADSQL